MQRITVLWKKVTSLVVAVAMVCSMSSIQAFADQPDVTGANTNTNSYYVVTLGDSVSSGFNLEGFDKTRYLQDEPSSEPYPTNMDPGYNLHRSPVDSYPYRVANYIYDDLTASGYLNGSQGDFGYFDDGTDNGFHWSNLSASSMNTSALIGILNNEPDTDFYLSKFVTHDISYYHDLFVGEIQKADLITVEVGNNDLLVSTNAYFESRAETNAAFAIAYEILYQVALGVISADNIDVAIEEAVESHADELTVKDVIELMEFTQADNLSAFLASCLDETESNLKTIDSKIREINTKEDLQIVWVGAYNPYGTSLTLTDNQGVETSYDLGAILTRTLDNIEDAVEEECDPCSESFWDDFWDDDSDFWSDDSDFDDFWDEAFSDDEDADVDGIIDELANMSEEDFETVIDFLDSYADRADEFVVGDGTSMKALIEKLRRDPDGYLCLMAAFACCSEKSQDKVMTQLEEELRYPFMHLMLGETCQDALDELSQATQDVAEETGGIYVDIMGMPGESNSDPHPNAAGHAYIAQQVESVLPAPVTPLDAGGDSPVGASCLVGDANGNGKVNIVDAQIVFEASNGQYQGTKNDGVFSLFGKLLDLLANGWDDATMLRAADANGSGAVDATDARAIQHYSVAGRWA